MRVPSRHSIFTSQPRFRALTRLFVVAATVCMFGTGIGSAEAKSKTSPVEGTFQTQVQPPELCPPPLHLCATGVATGDIAGDVQVVIEQSTIVFDAVGLPYSQYSGTITISAAKGDLVGRVDGRVRLTDGALASTASFTSGTRGYHKTTGTLHVQGTINLYTGSEFDTYTGELIK